MKPGEALLLLVTYVTVTHHLFTHGSETAGEIMIITFFVAWVANILYSKLTESD